MRMIPVRTRAAAMILPVLFVATAGCDIAMADLRQSEKAEWRKTYDLQPGGRFEISNVNGTIDVRPADGNTVEVVAEKIAKGASSEAAKEALQRIEIQESVSPGAVRLETKFQRGGGLFGGGNFEVRYTVRVPAGVEVRVSTVNGGIELSGMKGRVVAETVNGGIRADDLSGPVEANTTNGGVDVRLTQLSGDGVKLGCTNGGIKLRLPPDAKATISARVANGWTRTRFFARSPVSGLPPVVAWQLLSSVGDGWSPTEQAPASPC